jgi:hypothetical protein
MPSKFSNGHNIFLVDISVVLVPLLHCAELLLPIYVPLVWVSQKPANTAVMNCLGSLSTRNYCGVPWEGGGHISFMKHQPLLLHMSSLILALVPSLSDSSLRTVTQFWIVKLFRLVQMRTVLSKVFRFLLYIMRYGSRGSSVSIVSGYGLDERAIEVRSSAEVRGFFL